jgi:hypothetical protein
MMNHWPSLSVPPFAPAAHLPKTGCSWHCSERFDETRDFLKALLLRCQPYRQTTCLTLTAIHPDGQHPTPSRHILLDDTDTLNEAVKHLLAANAAGWGAYFAVGLRRPGLGRWRRGGAGDIVALPALFVDLDDPSPEALIRLRAFPLAPSCVVDSGGGGFHAYWWLDTPATALDRAGRILRGLSAHFGSDPLSVAQSLRLPQTLNTKRHRGGWCRVIDLAHHRFALMDFEILLPVGDLPSEKRKKPYTTVQTVHASPHKRLNPALVEAVVNRLCRDYEGYLKDNGYLASLCPCGHQHDAPGKHFNFDLVRGFGVCFGRHGRLLLRDLCSLLHVDPAAYGGFYSRKE